MYSEGDIVRVKTIAELALIAARDGDGNYCIEQPGKKVVYFSEKMRPYAGMTLRVRYRLDGDSYPSAAYLLSLPLEDCKAQAVIDKVGFAEWMLERVSPPEVLGAFIRGETQSGRAYSSVCISGKRIDIAHSAVTVFSLASYDYGDRITAAFNGDEGEGRVVKSALAIYGYRVSKRDGVYTVTEDATGTVRGVVGKDIHKTLLLPLLPSEEIPVHICEECGEEFPEGECTYINGSWVCGECRDEHYVKCEGCGEYIRENDALLQDDSWYCSDCYEERYTRCCRCDSVIERSSAFEYHSDYYCDSCRDEAFNQCDRCGDWVPNDEGRYEERSDAWVCNSCYNDREDIHDYGYRPNPLFYGDTGREVEDKDTLYMGMEQEIYVNDVGGTAADILAADSGEKELYLKHDASLERGFEIVTHPRTYKSWRKFVEEGTFRRVLEIEAGRGARGHGKGGIHIHSSFAPWSKRQYTLLFCFIFNPDNREKLYTLSQRHNCGKDFGRSTESCSDCKYSHACMSHYSSLLSVDIGKSKEDLMRKRAGVTKDRYSALNIPRGEQTVEFRLFNSSTRPDRILKNIEVVQSLFDYTAELEKEEAEQEKELVDERVPWDWWTAFVRKSGAYPYLLSFLEEKCLIAPSAEAAAFRYNNNAGDDEGEAV